MVLPEGYTGNAVLLALALLIPFVGALLIPLFAHGRNVRETISLTTAAMLFLTVLQLLDVFIAGSRPHFVLWQMMPGISFSLGLRPLGILFAAMASFLWLITTLYSIGYLRHHNALKQTRYYLCFALSMGAAIGIALADNLLTLFIFYEVLTLATYPLVVHNSDMAARRSGRLYIGILMSSSMLFLLPAIFLTWKWTGTLEFARGGFVAGHMDKQQMIILLMLFVFGTAKAALLPLHRWLPAAMVAPAPVSALLHAVAVVNAGVFTILTVLVYVFGIETLGATLDMHWLVWLCCGTILFASWVALRQDNLKLRLAYSTIAHLAYMVLGGAMLAPLSIVGAALHMVAHGFAKITLFFAAGNIHSMSHKHHIRDMAGIAKHMPWTMAAFTVASLSLIGLPLMLGFLGKWYMLLGAMQAGYYVGAATMIIATGLGAAYLLSVVKTAYLDAPEVPKEGEAEAHVIYEAPFRMRAPVLIGAFFSVLLFFFSTSWVRIAGEMLSLWNPVHIP